MSCARPCPSPYPDTPAATRGGDQALEPRPDHVAPRGRTGRPTPDIPSTSLDAPSADVLIEVLASALARPHFVEQLTTAVARHEADQTAHRAEIARLTA